MEHVGFVMKKTEPGIMGVSVIKEGIRIQTELHRNKTCGMLLYKIDDPKETIRIDFTDEIRFGNVYVGILENCSPHEYAYNFHEDGKPIMDVYAKKVHGHRLFGQEHRKAGISDKSSKCAFVKDDFSWGDDKLPLTKYENSIYYGMHVRGFTKDPSSGIKEAGTFLGIQKKITYLKKLGITGIVVQPLYEFEENLQALRSDTMDEAIRKYSYKKEEKINYWGYQKGFYFAPKNAYSYQEDSVWELKTLIRALHQNEMEIILQFFFPPEVTQNQMREILEYWSVFYHIDGFQLLGVSLPIRELAESPFLQKTKIWSENSISQEKYYDKSYLNNNLAESGRNFMDAARCFLKGDESSLKTFIECMKYQPASSAAINYLAFYGGFRLLDVVSYERKHNYENGENNQDGENYNCCWNCGEEGPSKKRHIRSLRLKLIKNALCFLFFAKGTPLIFMGDECGKTGHGNNNPYCQDNETTWKQWKLQKNGKEILSFTTQLIALRKRHSIIYRKCAARNMDTKKAGYPEISYHGKGAWNPDFSYYMRHIAIMLWDSSTLTATKTGDGFYCAYNSHWEAHEFALPKLPDDLKWRMIINTDLNIFSSDIFAESSQNEQIENNVLVEPRTVVIFISYKSDTPIQPVTKKRVKK